MASSQCSSGIASVVITTHNLYSLGSCKKDAEWCNLFVPASQLKNCGVLERYNLKNPFMDNVTQQHGH